MNKNLLNALDEQVNAELYSAYLYLAMSAHADRMGFKGFANWLYIQFREETEHGLHIRDFILERGETPTHSVIASPEADFGTLEEMFEKVLAHEKHVTKLINDIATLAMKENDHATYQFIMWYVNEQVEEESSAEDILVKLKHINGNTALAFSLDTELAARVFVNPFVTA